MVISILLLKGSDEWIDDLKEVENALFESIHLLALKHHQELCPDIRIYWSVPMEFLPEEEVCK